MKSKAPLAMMEQIVMVLVFALAAALCVQTFVLSGKISKKTEAENRAAVEAQNVAETMKNGGLSEYLERYVPKQTEDKYVSFFTKDWKITEEENQAEYNMTVIYKESADLFLWQADITLADVSGEELIRIPVAGQTEVVQNE